MFNILLNENPLILCICQVCVESLLLFKPATRANNPSKQASSAFLALQVTNQSILPPH